MELGQVCLRRGEERELRRGKSRVYDNEVAWVDESMILDQVDDAVDAAVDCAAVILLAAEIHPAPVSYTHLDVYKRQMQKRALIAMQYSALHNRTWKTPTVQKPCINRAPMAYKTKKP